MSHLAKILSSGKYGLFLVKGTDASKRRTYHYISVRNDKIDLFSRSINTHKNINLENYGKILASGYGFVPDIEVTQKVAELFRNEDS